MNKTWPFQSLQVLAEVFGDGDWIETKDQSPGGIRLVQTGNVGEGAFKDRGEKARYVSEATFKRLGCTEIFEGDCLISRLPDPVGRSCLLPDTGERMITAVDCTIVRFNRSRMVPEFFNYYTQSHGYLTVVETRTTGSTRKRISRSNLGEIPVPVPPLTEQRRIVGILDEAFEGIATAKANAEKNLQNAREVFDGYLDAALSSESIHATERKFDELCDITSALVDPRLPDCLDLVHVGAGNIESRTGRLCDLKTARDEGLISGKFSFDRSMVLYSKIRPYLMKVARPNFDGLCSADIYPLAPRPGKMDRDYLFFLLLTKSFTDYAVKGSARAGMPKVNREHLFEFKTQVPPLKVQVAISKRLDRVREVTVGLEVIYQEKLDALDELKKSLLDRAFRGEL